MAKNILIITGSRKKNGNTALLVDWFCQGARLHQVKIETVNAAYFKPKTTGCISCRQCQKKKEYGCVIKDDVQSVLLKMLEADAIVMATPLYFFSASAQLKMVLDRMFSLYKWDNDAGTMDTPLKGKRLIMIGSAFEGVGLKSLEAPFKLTASYTGMPFYSLLVPYAGVSGDIRKNRTAHKKAAALGKKIADIIERSS